MSLNITTTIALLRYCVIMPLIIHYNMEFYIDNTLLILSLHNEICKIGYTKSDGCVKILLVYKLTI